MCNAGDQKGAGRRGISIFPSLSMDATLIGVGVWHPPPSGEHGTTIWDSRARRRPLRCAI